MLFISEGVDYNIYDVFNNQSASTVLDETRDAIGAATRANVSIYSIDPRGLATIGDEAIELTPRPRIRRSGSTHRASRTSSDCRRTASGRLPTRRAGSPP